MNSLCDDNSFIKAAMLSRTAQSRAESPLDTHDGRNYRMLMMVGTAGYS